MDTCVACGAELGVGRFCLNCGHRIGAPAPVRLEPGPASQPATATTTTAPPPDRPAQADEERSPAPVVPPVQAADPTPVPPTSPPDVVPGREPADPPAGRVAPPPSRRPTWDPREELLPYEEVDDVDGDLPVRGKAWIGWVLGAALLVGLAFVLLRVFDTEGDEVATDPADGATTGSQVAEPSDDPTESSAEPTEGSEAPTGVGKAFDLARGATFEVPGTAPPTTDFDGNLVAYEASQMGDGNPATAWRTAGDASGGTITVTLPETVVVGRVGLINGYAKQVAGVDWYPNNRRILAVTWGFDDGSSIEQTLAEQPGMQRLKVPPVETGTVTITIDAVTPPGPGSLGRDYTAISEVSVTGRRPG